MRVAFFYQLFREYQRELSFCNKSAVKVFNFWPLEKPEDLWFSQFFSFRGTIPANKALSIYSVFGDRFKMNFDLFRKKVFFTGENPVNRPNYLDHCLHSVDLSLGFDYLPQSNYMRFPLWYLYFIKPNSRLSDIEKWIEQIEQLSRASIHEARKFCSLVSVHDPLGHRKRVFDLVNEFGAVDSGGLLFNNTSDLKEKYKDDKVGFLKQYQFNICIENSERSGYVTEKIFHSLLAGSVPIYWGSSGAPEPDILNQSRILFFDPQRPELLRNRLSEMGNAEVIRDFVSQPVFNPGAASVIYERLDELDSRVKKIFS